MIFLSYFLETASIVMYELLTVRTAIFTEISILFDNHIRDQTINILSFSGTNAGANVQPVTDAITDGVNTNIL